MSILAIILATMGTLSLVVGIVALFFTDHTSRVAIDAIGVVIKYPALFIFSGFILLFFSGALGLVERTRVRWKGKRSSLEIGHFPERHVPRDSGIPEQSGYEAREQVLEEVETD